MKSVLEGDDADLADRHLVHVGTRGSADRPAHGPCRRYRCETARRWGDATVARSAHTGGQPSSYADWPEFSTYALDSGHP